MEEITYTKRQILNAFKNIITDIRLNPEQHRFSPEIDESNIDFEKLARRKTDSLINHM